MYVNVYKKIYVDCTAWFHLSLNALYTFLVDYKYANNVDLIWVIFLSGGFVSSFLGGMCSPTALPLTIK